MCNCSVKNFRCFNGTVYSEFFDSERACLSHKTPITEPLFPYKSQFLIDYKPKVAYSTDDNNTTVEVYSVPVSKQAARIKWKLYLEVGKNSLTSENCQNSRDVVSVYLGLVETEIELVYASYEFYWINDDNKIIETSTGNHQFNVNVKNSENRVKIGTFCVLKLLSSIDRKRSQSSVFDIRLRCEISVNMPALIPDCTMYDDIKSLLTDHEFADVVFQVQGKEFPAHKAILAQRSSVFKTMFSCDVKEKTAVFIEDIESDVFASLLNYIYSGIISAQPNIVEGLLQAAEKYDIQILKNICEEILTEHLAVTNAVNYFLLACRHNALYLRTKAVEYICMHWIKIRNTSEWLSMVQSMPQLVQEYFSIIVTSQT